jgi:hypothetical protein
MSAPVISRRTWSVFGALMVLFAVVTTLVVTGVLGEPGTLWVSDFGSFAVQAAAAVVILVTARSYGRGERVARPWWFIGLAVGAYAVGDLVWAFIEVVQKAEPWPSLADAFYGAEYVFMAIGLALAALAYRHLVDARIPLAAAILTGSGLAAALYVLVLGPQVVASTDMTVLEKVVSAGYPLADSLLLVAPALLVALTMLRLGSGRLAWPWWVALAGALLLAASDTVYSVMSALGTYVPGSPVDYGWMAAHVLVAFGALIARDVARA